MKINSLAFRLVAGAGLWITAALAAGGFQLSSMFEDSVERSFEARLEVHLDPDDPDASQVTVRPWLDGEA